jgi:hypothetical protein
MPGSARVRVLVAVFHRNELFEQRLINRSVGQ